MRKNDITGTVLLQAVTTENLELVKIFLEKGVNYDDTGKGLFAKSPLQMAMFRYKYINNNNPEIIKTLCTYIIKTTDKLNYNKYKEIYNFLLEYVKKEKFKNVKITNEEFDSMLYQMLKNKSGKFKQYYDKLEIIKQPPFEAYINYLMNAYNNKDKEDKYVEKLYNQVIESINNN